MTQDEHVWDVFSHFKPLVCNAFVLDVYLWGLYWVYDNMIWWRKDLIGIYFEEASGTLWKWQQFYSPHPATEPVSHVVWRGICFSKIANDILEHHLSFDSS